MKIPNIATGKVIPPKIQEQILKEEKAKAEKKAQRRHDYFVAAFSSVCGGITGLLTSFIFWLCTK